MNKRQKKKSEKRKSKQKFLECIEMMSYWKPLQEDIDNRPKNMSELIGFEIVELIENTNDLEFKISIKFNENSKHRIAQAKICDRYGYNDNKFFGEIFIDSNTNNINNILLTYLHSKEDGLIVAKLKENGKEWNMVSDYINKIKPKVR